MSTSSRRNKEFIEREMLFVNNAREILKTQGLNALTMEHVAEISHYSKGTIYKHFTCKEDLYCALTTVSLNYLLQLCITAKKYPGRPREQFIALLIAYRLYSERYPREFNLVAAARSADRYEKASSKFRQKHEELQSKLDEISRGVLRSAVANGDLTLDDQISVDLVLFGAWALNQGIQTLSKAPDLIKHLSLPDFSKVYLIQCHSLFDGYGWQPLSREWDYPETIQKAYCLISQEHPLSNSTTESSSLAYYSTLETPPPEARH